MQSRKQRLQLKKKTKETLGNLHSVLLKHHYLSFRKVVMGKRDIAAEVSTGKLQSTALLMTPLTNTSALQVGWRVLLIVVVHRVTLNVSLQPQYK